MQDLSKRLPMYVWLTALSQLTSRICHPHVETQRITQHILTRVTAQFPHQVTFTMFFACRYYSLPLSDVSPAHPYLQLQLSFPRVAVSDMAMSSCAGLRDCIFQLAARSL